MAITHFPGLPTSAEGLLAATGFLDIDEPSIQSFVARHTQGMGNPRERAVALFYAVRDEIRYDPYRLGWEDADYRASAVLAKGYGWCVSKAVLMAATLRAAGIPAALGFADVRNHLTTDKLRERMGGVDIFYNHGYAAALIDGHWLKLAPAFNIELCERFDVLPTEFDGSADALYQEFDARERLHMQYLADHGTYSDLPLDKIRADFASYYPNSVFAAHIPSLDDPFDSQPQQRPAAA
ncbi:MAG: transglutaminase family protein [Burkholderiaceae bacterium]